MKNSYLTASQNSKMSQNGEEAKAQSNAQSNAKNLNKKSVITFVVVDGIICIVSIVDPADPKNNFFGNGNGIIVPDNHITRKGSKDTLESERKQYTLRFENGKWNIYLDGTHVHTFDEIFGLPDGISSHENVSFHQFKYVPTADDERTDQFRQLLGQLMSVYPDRFCLEDPAKKMEIRVGGMKVRISQPIFELLKKLLINFGVSTCSFVEHLENGSKNGVSRGDIDLYVFDAEQAEIIIQILTELGFVKDSTDKSNHKTFRIYLDVLCQKFSCDAIIPHFNLPEGLDPAQYYIELEIKIATEFQKAYESNCLGYFLGLLLSHYFKISISGVSLKHGCDEIPIKFGSLDEFLKRLGINLDGIRTTQEFIERLLASPLISELLTVDDILRLYKNIMGDEKMKHTSKPLREWLHLLLCGLKERFPSLRSELVQEIVQDEKSGQGIPTWGVRLFVSNQGSENEIQMERGVLFIDCGKKLFVSTGADEMSLIFSEKQVKSDSGKQALPESVKSCSKLFELLKDSFDFLKGKKIPEPQIEQFVVALGCQSEVNSHLEAIKRKLTQTIRDELMKALFPKKTKQPDHMSGEVFGVLMKELTYFDVPFSQFQEFCEKHHLIDDYQSFVILSNLEIFNEYQFQIMALSQELSPEDHKRMRGEIYVYAMRNIERLCLDVVKQWTHFHNSGLFWSRQDETGIIHIPSQTSHKILSDGYLPYYLGTSVLIEEVPSELLKGKKQKGKQEGKKQKEKPQGKSVPEGEKQGTLVYVFIDGKSGEVFTVPISP